MSYKKEVSIKKVKEDAETLYRDGKFYCAESVVASIRENIDNSIPVEAIGMASGFAVGIGKSKCVCGAVSGAIMILGYFFGRTEGATSKKDPIVDKMLDLSSELQQQFRDKNKVLCCSVLTKDKSPDLRKNQCIEFTGLMAEEVAKIIVRELDIINLDEA